MLAVMDADYKFLWPDVGSNGSCSDAQIFNKYHLMQSIDENIGLPDADPSGNDRDTKKFTVADDACALRIWLMKPFPGRNLNNKEHMFIYRLSRARGVVENAFETLANHFRCLLTILEPHNVTSIGVASITLHNIIWTHYRADHKELGSNCHRNIHVGLFHGRTI